MGSSLHVILDNYIGSAPFPCHLQLGASTSIDLTKLCEKDDARGVVYEILKVLYTVDKETCAVGLRKDGVDEHGNTKNVTFVINDRISRYMREYCMEITKTNSITIRSTFSTFHFTSVSAKSTKTNRSFDAWGGVMDTTFYLYGNGSRWGLLIIVESKKNGMKEEAEVVTLAHYFVNGSGSSFDTSAGTDIGLSVVAKFGVCNGKIHTTVEGPEQHPVSALLYMFGEVNKTGIWKPSMCPHCDHKRRGKVFWQSDSEDSDSVSKPLPRATPRNARWVSNDGKFQGNGIGNFFENNFMFFRKRR